MTITFNPKHKWDIWLDYSNANGREIKADQVDVTPYGALIFSSLGSDNQMHVVRVQPPSSYSYFTWNGE
jgi:hypothetical protein